MTNDNQDRHFGWLLEEDDPRDYPVATYRPDLLAAALPPSVDLRGANQPPIQNQGSLGSCVAWACVRAYRYAHRKQGTPDFDGSELFTYYNARAYQGWQDRDSGAYLRDGIKALAQHGNAEESTWPYVIGLFGNTPLLAAYDSAAKHQATRYLSVPNNEQAIKGVISGGYPVVFGIVVYQNFPMGNGVRVIPMPQGQVVGGHAMAYVGYDDARQAYLVANSWGESWGVNGYAWLPYAYNAAQASDHWMIEAVEGAPVPPPPPAPDPAEIPFYESFIRYDQMRYKDGKGVIWTSTGKYDAPS